MALSIHSSGLEDGGESREGRWREVHPRIYPPCLQAATRAVSAVTYLPVSSPRGGRGPPLTPVFPWIPFQSRLNASHSWVRVYPNDAPWGRRAIHSHFTEPEVQKSEEKKGNRGRGVWRLDSHLLTITFPFQPFTTCLFFLPLFSPGAALDSSIFGASSHLIWLRKSRVEGLIRAKE